MQAITGADTSFEKFIADKASILETPIGANLELTPVCNMDCKMCYVRTDMKEVKQLGGYPDKELWMKLGREMKDMGTLFVLLTGGEPLLYPHFKEVYLYYRQLGFVLTVNTNGTLLDEEWADFFAEYPPRRLNITIYGKDNETYEKLCCNPKGFDQLNRAIRLLKEARISFRLNTSITRYNYHQLKDFHGFAKELGVALEAAYYMMPPARKVTHSHIDGIWDGVCRSDSLECSRADQIRAIHESSRLSPEQAAEAAYFIFTSDLDEEKKREYIERNLAKVEDFLPDQKYKEGFWCRAGNSSFWVNWDGTMTACGMMGDKDLDLKKESFPELWEKVKARAKKVHLASECTNCRLQALCPHCASSEYTENGGFGKAPEYLCQFSQAYYQLLKRKASELSSGF